MNDEFDAIVADLDIEEPEIDYGFAKMSNLKLMREFHRAKEDLMDHNALLDPQTEEDKDLQGYYFGVTSEMRRRKML